MTGQAPPPRPEDDSLYRAIMMVLIGSILLGAALTLTGEALFGSRPLATVGLGMAGVAFVAYWGLRIKARAATRRAEAAAAEDEESRG